MFPDIEYYASGIDEEQWQIFDSNDGNNVRDFIIRLLQRQRKMGSTMDHLMNHDYQA